jgi:hypothetical protein
MRNFNLSLLAFAVSASLAGNALAQNDDCTGAVSVIQGPNGPFTNVGSSTSTPAWPCAAGGSDVWYVYVAPAAGSLTLDVCGASYDSALEIFDGSAGCGALTSIACNDDSCGLASSITTTVNAGTTYYIRVGGFASSTGTFTLNINGPLGSGTLATNTTVGAGCGASYNSFYQQFTDSALASPALTGNALLLVPTASGYVGTWLPGTASAFYVAPVAATQLVTGDDNVATFNLTGSLPTPQGPQSSLLVSGNAIVAWGGAAMDYPGTNSYTPTANGFLNSTLGGVYAWHDYNQAEAGSGQIVSEQVGNVAYVTFNGVESYPTGTANPSTLQFQFDLSTGNITLVFLSIDSNTTSTFGSGHLIGVTAPGTSLNPGSINLATATLVTVDPEAAPLAVAATSRPITGTNWGLNVTNVPATGVIGVDVFGLSNPGIPDLAFLGLPGCGLSASLDIINAWPVAGSSHAHSLAIPSNPSLISLHIFTTSAVFQVPPINAFGAITSNGIDGSIGDV